MGAEAVGCVPLAGPSMQLIHRVTRLNVQAVMQQIDKEMMIAIPLARLIERYDEEIGLLQSTQHVAAVAPVDYRITQGRGKTIEDGGLEPEILHIGRVGVEDLGRQIVQEVL